MSIITLHANIAGLERDICNLDKQINDERRKENDKEKQIHQCEKYIAQNKNISLSSYDSKRREIQRLKDEQIQILKREHELSKKLSQKKQSLRRMQEQLSKEQEKERQKAETERKKKEREQLAFQRKLFSEIQQHKSQVGFFNYDRQTSQNIPLQNYHMVKKYDFFISHASEDKETFVRDLATELTAIGVKVWYDEFQLRVGDGLRRSIDNGLKNSRYGIVVLSSSFFAKNWTQYELDGLFQREMNGVKVILPVWHKVSKDEVQSFSFSLADKFALNTSMYSIKQIAQKLKELLEESPV
jgi:hypothetical protein